MLLLVAPTVSGATVRVSGDPRFAPTPSWVVEFAAETGGEVPADRISGGVYYLLRDSQENALGSERQLYRHVVKVFVNEQGVQNGSQLEIPFDPDYETVVIHQVQVERQGQLLDKLDRGRVRVIQREQALESEIYDGAKTVLLFLDDVRIGDVLDFRYTVVGDNPVYQGKFLSGFSVNTDVPLRQLRHRLLWPRGRPLTIHRHETELKPRWRRNESFVEYRWEASDLDAVLYEDGYPSWHWPFPWIQFTEFQSWEEVCQWGAELYQTTETPPEIRELADDLESRHQELSDRVLEALRFVQNEIRYLGIELGEGAIRPSSPATVVQRRYGDCKDKTNLLIVLLRELGVTAHPALVSSSLRRHADRCAPSPSAFNHVVTRISLPDQVLWVDPTWSRQGGTLTGQAPLPYEKGLVLRHQGEPWEAISRPPLRSPDTAILKVFQLQRNRGAQMTVETQYRGEEADWMRGRLVHSSREGLEQDYLNYYAHFYPDIEFDSPLVVHDDPVENLLSVEERYWIPSFLQQDRSGGNYAELSSVEVQTLLPRPSTRRRTMPFVLDDRRWVVVDTIVNFQDPWKLESYEGQVSNPAFLLRAKSECHGKQLHIETEFRSFSDHVLPEDFAQYLEDCDQAHDLLTWQPDESRRRPPAILATRAPPSPPQAASAPVTQASETPTTEASPLVSPPNTPTTRDPRTRWMVAGFLVLAFLAGGVAGHGVATHRHGREREIVRELQQRQDTRFGANEPIQQPLEVSPVSPSSLVNAGAEGSSPRD